MKTTTLSFKTLDLLGRTRLGNGKHPWQNLPDESPIVRLAAFVAARPCLEGAAYSGDCAGYRPDPRQTVRDLTRCRAVFEKARLTGVTDADLLASVSGRLTWDGSDWSYVPGEFGPTEYRPSAAYLLERAITRAQFNWPAVCGKPARA